ncbi:MAG: hypothetical protein EOO28_04480 [Comamonadaceae bacterium]|nr:MAG: hypothetical protein EOO28_04480 [Comamonadaceae bacterium]
MATRSLKNVLIRLRDEVRLGDCVHYRNSDTVLTWLVLFEVSKLHVVLPPALDHVLYVSFTNASQALRDGKIRIDYTPPVPETTFDLPEAKHPMYMQALLYWCTKFDCTPEVLVDAHSRLGRSATVARAFLEINGIKREEGRGEGGSRPGSNIGTMPAFLATLPYR